MEGIIPTQMLKNMTQDEVITSDYTIPPENYQPASLDLRLGETAHILRCSFLPHGMSVEEKLSELSIGEIDIRDGAILERNRPYLIPLLERINLPEGISARANPKSSTGRLDIFTRVITDGRHEFDDIAPGYQGKMYLEVFSRTFTIKVRTRLSLNQVRLFKGNPKCAPGKLRTVHDISPIIIPAPGNKHQGPTPAPSQDNSLGFTINLRDKEGIGYRARKNSALLDLSEVGEYDPQRLLGKSPLRQEQLPDPRTRGVLPPGGRRGSFHSPGVRSGDEGLPVIQRRAPNPLRRLLRPRLRVRRERPDGRSATGVGSQGPRRALHDRTGPEGLHPDLREDAGAPGEMVRSPGWLLLPESRKDTEQALQRRPDSPIHITIRPTPKETPDGPQH